MSISLDSDLEALCSNFERIQITNYKERPPEFKNILIFPETIRRLNATQFWQVVEKVFTQERSFTHISIAGVGLVNKNTFQYLSKQGCRVEAVKIRQFIHTFHQLGLTITQDGANLTRFHLAAITGIDSLMPDVAADGELEVPDPKGRSALQLCVLQGHIAVAKRLVALGADPNSPTPFYGSALSLALQRGEQKLSMLFLDQKRVSLVETNCFTCYQLEVYRRSNQIFRIEEVATILFTIPHERKSGCNEKFEKIVSQDRASHDLLVSYYEYETLIRSLCHSCDIPMSQYLATGGILSQSIYFKNQKETLCFTPVVGGYAPFCLQEMARATRSFQQFYPALQFSYERFSLNRLEVSLEFAANQPQKSAPEVINRCMANEPTMVIVDLENPAHTVTVIIWYNHFIICNRGACMRKPVEVYTYCRRYLTEDLIKQMLNGFSSAKNYNAFFFTKLPQALCFRQTPMERSLEKAFTLPAQVTGNCSWKSSETAAYCYFVLSLLDHKHLLFPDLSFDDKIESQLIAADSFFKNWLYYQQLQYIEKYIKISRVKDPCFLTTLALLPQIQAQLDTILQFPRLLPELRQKAKSLKEG